MRQTMAAQRTDRKQKLDSSKSIGWYGELKEKLSSAGLFEDFLSKFSQCSTDEGRLRSVYECADINNIITVEPTKKGKSAEMSVSLRNQGNKVFQKRYNQKALDLYNEAVINAPSIDSTLRGSSNDNEASVLALALANRSAVLFHMKYYLLCLKDIDAAFKAGYPAQLKYKLLERQGKCFYQLHCKDEAKLGFEGAKLGLKLAGLEQEKRNNIINEFDKQVWQCDKLTKTTSSEKLVCKNQFHCPIPVLGKKTNPMVSSLSDAVSVFVTEDQGRGLVATRDVDIGELLIVENPYTSTLLPDFKFTHCHHCCNRVIALYSCTTCTEVVFCSERCQKLAWESYHKLECDILPAVRETEISLGHLALRMVLNAGFNYLKKFEVLDEDTDEPTMPGVNENGDYDSEDYRTVYHLVNHSTDRKVEDTLKYTLEAIFLLKCLEKTEYFHGSSSGGGAEVGDKFTVGVHILRHLQMLPCNAHEVSELALKHTNMPESVTMEIGSAIYPVLSLINHSCDPNVVRHSYGDICVVRAIRGIPKGAEVLDNYGALHALTPCAARREKLAVQYYFTCNCLACVDDSPLYFDTPSEIPVFQCEACCGPVFIPDDRNPTHAICSSCKKLQDITQKMTLLARSDDLYRATIQQVLTDTSGNLDSFIPTLETHLKLMNRFVCRPWRDYNDCQEALKQCYAVQASHFSVS